jgi:hypothetical protein
LSRKKTAFLFRARKLLGQLDAPHILNFEIYWGFAVLTGFHAMKMELLRSGLDEIVSIPT